MTSSTHGSSSRRVAGFVGLIIILATASFLAAWAPVVAQSDDAAGFVNTEDVRLNLRSGPGVDYAIVGKLDPGSAVQILDASDDGLWYELASADEGLSGWAASEFVTMGEQPTVSDASPTRSTPRFGPRFIPSAISGRFSSMTADRDDDTGDSTASAADEAAEGDEANDAPLADEDAAAQAAVDSDTPDDVTEFVLPEPTPEPNDTPVQDNAIEADPADAVNGAEDADDVDEAPDVDDADEAGAASEPTLAAAVRPAPTVPTAVTQPDRMNVRAGPGTNYGIVTSVPAGTDMEILALGPLGEWYQVRLAGQEDPAWLFAGLADALGPMDGLARVAEGDVPPAPEPVAAAASAAPSAVVVAAPPPSGAGFFGYGIQAHLLGGQAGSAMTSISELGFNWVKQQVQWKDFQPQAGAIGMGELGGIVSAAQGRGINVLFSVVNAPPWAREDGFDERVGGPPADPQTYANFVGAMAGQFCGTSLKAIEVWNEQNLHYEWGNKPLDPVEYMNLLKPAYAAIKAACPEMLVISGALTPAASNGSFAMDDFAYLEAMYQNGLAAYSDGIGAHPSGYNVPASVRWEDACAAIQQTGNSFNGACDTPHHSWAFRSTMEGYRNIMTVYGDTNKRIWPTEFGWAAGGAFDPRYAYANDNSFDEQARWTVEAYTMMRDWGWVGPAFLWNLNFRVVADGTEKAQWGIVGNDWQPLPTYYALQAMPK